MEFKKADRKQVKLKLGIAGPSGSGKTFSGLLIARGLLESVADGGRIALIDSENKSASLYSGAKGIPPFDVLELEPPYTVDKYIEAMELAIKSKYDLLVVDSVSHVWSGEGGLLQEKETLDGRGGNSYTNWAKMTPKWNRFVSAILHSDIHMICTMRSKQDYVLETNDKGKQAPKKVGMAPQVREGFEYELTAVLDMDMTHHAQASKDRTGLFDGKTWKPDAATGKQIYQWLSSGKAADPAPAPAPTPMSAEEAQVKRRQAALAGVVDPVKWPMGSVVLYMKDRYGTPKIGDLIDLDFLALLETVKTKTSTQARVELASVSKAVPKTLGDEAGPMFDEPGTAG